MALRSQIFPLPKPSKANLLRGSSKSEVENSQSIPESLHSRTSLSFLQKTHDIFWFSLGRSHSRKQTNQVSVQQLAQHTIWLAYHFRRLSRGFGPH